MSHAFGQNQVDAEVSEAVAALDRGDPAVQTARLEHGSLLAALRIAEREGQGLDRMMREMVAVGHAPPDIREISSPYVPAALVGDDVVDVPRMARLAEILPIHRRDLQCLLILRRLVTSAWADVGIVVTLIQLTVEEARGAIEVLAICEFSGEPLIQAVAGTSAGAEEAWRLSRSAVTNA